MVLRPRQSLLVTRFVALILVMGAMKLRVRETAAFLLANSNRHLRKPHKQQARHTSSVLPLQALRFLNHDQQIQFIAAPMVAASDYAFRCLCRQHGVDLTFTQMLHSENVLTHQSFRRNHFDFYECMGTPREWSTTQQELLGGCRSVADDGQPLASHTAASTGPLVVQLAGYDPGTVSQAAQLILDHSDGQIHGFDLNLGCPQTIARKGRYGAFLMEQDPAAACSVLSELRRSLPDTVTVSAKIRLPLDKEKLPERITRLLDTGIDFLTVHGRTLRENKVAVAACHLDEIARAVDLAHERDPNFPVVANGGIETMADVEQVRRLTKTVAVMSSEALLENPGVFTIDSTTWSVREIMHQQFGYAQDYLRWCRYFPPLPGVLGYSHNIVRGHLFKFLFRYLSEHTDLRDQMASRNVRSLTDFGRLCQELYRRYEHLTDDQLAMCASSHAANTWYRRHRNSQTPSVERTGSQLSTTQRKEAAKIRIAKLREDRKKRDLLRQHG